LPCAVVLTISNSVPGPPRRLVEADLNSAVTGSVAVIATAIGGVLVIVYVTVSAAVDVKTAGGIGMAIGAVVVGTAVGIGVAVGAVVVVGVGVRVAVMRTVGWIAPKGKNVRVPVIAVPGSLAPVTVAVMAAVAATAETVAARVAVAGATVAGVTPGDEVAVAVFVGRNASEIAVALCGTAVGSDVFVAATAGMVLVAVGGGTALPWSAVNSSSVGTATQPARRSNRQNERRMAI
jgi:hypothetical protein